MSEKRYTVFAYTDSDTRRVTRVGVTGLPIDTRVAWDVESGRAKSTDIVTILESSDDEGKAIEVRAAWIKMFRRGTSGVFSAL